MFVLLAVLALAAGGIVYKCRERLGFQSGRLRRANQAKQKNQSIQLSFGEVHYDYSPGSNSSANELNIFVHGFSIPMEIWDDVYQSFLQENRPCLRFDLYGRGYSDAPNVPMNVDLFVSQLAELLYALDLPHKKYNLLGVSMGGAIVQRFAQIYPSNVSRLILCCAAGLGVKGPSNLILTVLAIPILGPILFKLVMGRSENKTARAQWAHPDSEQYRKFTQLFRDTCQQHPGFLRSLRSTVLNFDFKALSHSTDQINRLNIPILIVWGDQDALIPVANAYEYHKRYQNSVLKIVPGANHSLLIEHAKETIDAIKTFLREN